MPIAAFTFGSFGDIVTIVQLAFAIKKALSDSRGSLAECRMLVAYLDDFTRSMDCLKPWVSRALMSDGFTSDPTQPTLNQASLNAIRYAIATCERLLTEFKGKLSPYEASLVQGGSGNWFLDFRRRIGWRSSLREDAIDLRRNLVAQGDELHQYLKFLFRNRAGRTFVDHGNYDLTSQVTSQLVVHQSWSEYVQPGVALVMSALVKVSSKDRRVCPKCKTLNDATPLNSESSEIKCLYCRTIFRVYDDRFEEIVEDGPTNLENSSSLPSKQSKKTGRRNPRRKNTEDETQLVRRISVIPLIFRARQLASTYSISSPPPPPSTLSSAPSVDWALQADGSIKCICGLNDGDDGGPTIACDTCRRRVHAECFDIDQDRIPEGFLCGICEPRQIDIERAVELQKARRSKQSNVNVRPAIPTLHGTQFSRNTTKSSWKKASSSRQGLQKGPNPPLRPIPTSVVQARLGPQA
ncbi:hypothetical protein PHLCEN_2v12249 [Hermanssonia centrifuga]|uniref:Zinc finger PHD-type domain-containing protein n=1 Tax=Hermanssonia centrifuga TaxID=98765 RepID=A0A2R6NHN9_9APHY|nr:hypothetical protein PHLCEN_2v12249 [Hermanssonia centrifuga]